ncbi:MAG TPA: hypothetical protein DCG19_10135 [Cryomorphaceae bacterium]|nr:hypothetical protein [Owenweeksia sp.]MBG00062.1 hypothetical protein [Owenweeksia sp.]HAD97754.1 hypothetical protein [Cryomorphaceae bacterium]HCQ15408.1 hypothetical protein [Cryomorphaceae bacterium]|tara:strand:- start:2882 stop:3685 length:804 start_codon:yes stop_codon:yes gene_type:complete
MKRIWILLLFPCWVSAQNYGNLSGGRSAAMAHSSVAIEDVWAAHHNQAALAWLKKPEMGLSYENRYFLKDLAIGNSAFVYPTEWGTLGLSMSYFGFELYNQSKFGLNYSRAFGRFFSFGLQVNYENFYVSEGTTTSGAVTYEAGIIGKPLPGLNIGFHIYNPTSQLKNTLTEETLPYIGRLGVRYEFSKDAALHAEVRKQQELPERYALGFEYRLIEILSLRTGAALQPLTNTFGLGLKFASFRTDLAYEYAQVLGSNATISLQYEF